jgi:hypothetical protein
MRINRSTQDKVSWRKSTHSNKGGDCVEVADLGIGVRDSKDPNGPVLFFARAEWRAFVAGVLTGEFDNLGATGQIS